MTNPSPKRGEIWLSNLNPTQGSEQAGIRPVIIFQNDLVSQFLTTSIAIPLQGKRIKFLKRKPVQKVFVMPSGFWVLT
jgi:mRNA-degrading endonuclease toxin of MazEF toxin-antitoxin module